MENKFNIGTLDTRIVIQQCVISLNDEGAKQYTFTDYQNVFANIDARANEQVSEGNLEQGEFITATIYKIPALTTRWRVKYDGNLYEITGIDNVSRISPVCVLSLHFIGTVPTD